MSAANYQDLPCLSCLTRGCTDTVDEDHDLIITLCGDCNGDGYLNAAQAETQRAARAVNTLARLAIAAQQPHGSM